MNNFEIIEKIKNIEEKIDVITSNQELILESLIKKIEDLEIKINLQYRLIESLFNDDNNLEIR